MNIFQIKKILFLCVLSLFFLSLSLYNQNFQQDIFRKKSYFLVVESQAFLTSLQSSVSNQIKKYFFLLGLRKENKRLKEENQKLLIQQQTFKNLLKENERLREIVNFPLKKKMKTLATQVISYDFLASKELLIVNKGSKDGVKPYMGVLHPKGVLGFVFRVSPNSSQIITLKHPLASVKVRNQRTRTIGLLLSSAGQTQLHFWNEQSQASDAQSQLFKDGDVFVTVKSHSFPAGLLVGEISSLSLKRDQTHPVIKTFVNFESLEEFFILLEPFESPFPVDTKNDH